MTNREKYIDNASNEELAKWLTYRHIYSPLTNRIVCYDAIKENSLEINNMKYWLSQEAEEDNTEKDWNKVIDRIRELSERLDKLEKCNRIAEVKEHIEERLKEETKELTKNMRPMTKKDEEEFVKK